MPGTLPQLIGLMEDSEAASIEVMKKVRDMGTHEKTHILAGIDGIDFHYFTGADVVRHPLVQKIIEAYDRYRHPITSTHEEEERT